MKNIGPSKRAFFKAMVDEQFCFDGLKDHQWLAMTYKGLIYLFEKQPILQDIHGGVVSSWFGSPASEVGSIDAPENFYTLDYTQCVISCLEVRQLQFESKVDEAREKETIINKEAEDRKVQEFLALFKDEAPDSWI